MSLQGPAWPRCVRRSLSSAPRLRRPCILLVLAVLTASPATAKCHLFSVWHYPKPQKCFTALASLRYRADLVHEVRTEPESRTNQEIIPIPLPDLSNIVWGEIGPEELRAIALLRELYNGR